MNYTLGQKLILWVLLIFIPFYLIGAGVAWDINPRHWDAKGLWIIIVSCSYFFVLLAHFVIIPSLKKEDKS